MTIIVFMKLTLGYKYAIFPNDEQKQILNHQMFIYNQAYNICLNIQQKQWEANKNLDKKDRIYPKASQIDAKIKVALKQRELSFKTVVTGQARINCEKALKSAFEIKDHGFPKFKNSKTSVQSFNWNNQGFQIQESENSKFKILRIMSKNIQLKFHREFPNDAKINQITISKSGKNYYASFSITFGKTVFLISKESLELKKAVGIDLNIEDIALSSGNLIKTDSKNISKIKYNKKFLNLQRKQSRRVLKSKKLKVKLGANFKKTQNKLNAIFEKVKNKKTDYCHKISSELIKKFDLIVVEDLKTKNMTKRAKLKNVKQKLGLNRSILNTSFYQFATMLQYKSKLFGKLFVKVPPQYTSKTCSSCAQINKNLKLRNRVFECICGFTQHRDTNASKNILSLRLKSFGNLVDSKYKAFRSDSIDFAS